MTSPRLFEVGKSHDDNNEEDPEPIVKLGDLSPAFFEEGIAPNDDDDEQAEPDPEPLVKLGDLSPLFFE